MDSSSQQPALGGRLASLDAWRGFDMFWLLGEEQIVHALCVGARVRRLQRGGAVRADLQLLAGERAAELPENATPCYELRYGTIVS